VAKLEADLAAARESLCAAHEQRQGLSLPGGVRLVTYMDHTGCHQLDVFWLSPYY
jgi:hypothetical protein